VDHACETMHNACKTRALLRKFAFRAYTTMCWPTVGGGWGGTVGQHIPPIKSESSYPKSAISFAGAALIFAGCAYWSFINNKIEARCPTQKVMNIFLLPLVTHVRVAFTWRSKCWLGKPRASHLLRSCWYSEDSQNKLICVKMKVSVSGWVLSCIKTTLSWVFVIVIHRFSLIADF
jgi:hypothetical protein